MTEKARKARGQSLVTMPSRRGKPMSVRRIYPTKSFSGKGLSRRLGRIR